MFYVKLISIAGVDLTKSKFFGLYSNLNDLKKDLQNLFKNEINIDFIKLNDNIPHYKVLVLTNTGRQIYTLDACGE